jgi:hypothetical protein
LALHSLRNKKHTKQNKKDARARYGILKKQTQPHKGPEGHTNTPPEKLAGRRDAPRKRNRENTNQPNFSSEENNTYKTTKSEEGLCSCSTRSHKPINLGPCYMKPLRKEVIQPHLPVRLPCYDFTPITDPTFDSSLLTVRPLASGVTDFRGVTGGVYKARERIHPGVADPGLLATPTSRSRVADCDPN